MALPELKSNILPDNEIITTHTQDGAEVISQLQQNPNSVESYVSTGNTIQTTHNVVPQVLTVLKENGQDITTVVEGFWDVVWSVNGQTGDVTIDAVVGNFIPNHTYRQNSIIMHEGQMYRAITDFTTVGEFNPADWNEINPKSAIVFDLFQANHHYYARQPIWQDNSIYVANAEFTSGSTFNPDDWTQVSGSGGVANITSEDETVTVVTGEESVDLSIQSSLDPIIESLGDKVDKVEGKGLSTNDYTTAEKTKLSEIEAGAEKNAPNTVIDANYVHTDNNYTTTEKTNLSNIQSYVPAQASTSNQLADKAFVNSTVQTGTANFRGNWDTWNDVPANSALYPADYGGAHTPTVNDYLVVRDASDYEGGQRILPTEYAQLDYIENNGTQYINTGITPSQVDTVDMYLSISDTSKTSQYFAGTRSGSTAIGYALYFTAHGGLNYYPLAWGANGYAATQGTKIHFTTVMSSGNGSCKIDDKSILSKTYNQNTYEGGADIYIGAIRETGGSANYGSYAKFYEIIFSKDGEEVAHYIPAKDSSDTIGFFDLVSQTFIAGTGTFIAGPEVTPEDLEGTWRFKYSGVWETVGKNGWKPEYQVNETPMTAAQLAALNSGITASKIASVDTSISSINSSITTLDAAVTELDNDKVDKVTGKGLSTNDYTTTEKNKLAGIAAGAEVNVQSDWNQTSTSADDYIKNKPTIPTKTEWYGTCSTAAGTAAKTVTTQTRDFSLTTGATVYVKMTNANSAASPTLNVDSKGAKSIAAYGTTAAQYYWGAGEMVGLVYDGTRFIIIGKNPATTTYYGVTKLSSAVDSTSTALSATPSAVKSAYDLANTKAKVTVTTTDPGEGATIGTNEIIAVTGTDFLSFFYPVGSIYMSATLDTAAKVGAALGGTWVAWGAGRVPVGMGNNGTTNYTTVEATGGEDKHTLVESELPHISGYWTIHGAENGTEFYNKVGHATGSLVSNKYTNTNAHTGANSYTNPGFEFGSDGSHENRQPYITCYMYKRTA